jgi:hypothetical protein
MSSTGTSSSSNTQRKKRRRRIGTFTHDIKVADGSRHFRLLFWRGEDECIITTHVIRHSDGETVVVFDKRGEFEGYITPKPLQEVLQKAGFLE